MIPNTVTQTWIEYFPELYQVAGSRLLRINGPVLTGVELKELPGIKKYRPYIVVYALFGTRDGNDLKGCLSYPLYMRSFSSGNDGTELEFDYNLPLDPTAINLIKHTASLKLTSAAYDFKAIGNAIKRQIYHPPLDVAGNSFLKGEILKNLYIFYRLSGEDSLAAEVAQTIKNIAWDVENFRLWKVDPHNWNSLEAIDFVSLEAVVSRNTEAIRSMK